MRGVEVDAFADDHIWRGGIELAMHPPWEKFIGVGHGAGRYRPAPLHSAS
jgi:hypothetical protein